MERHRPALVWISVCHCDDARLVGTSVQRILEELRGRQIACAVGGRSAARLGLCPEPGVFVGTRLTELDALARGVASAHAGSRGS